METKCKSCKTFKYACVILVISLVIGFGFIIS